MSKKPSSILDLIQIGLPPIGKRILLHEVRQTTGREFWSVGTPFVSKKGKVFMGIEGSSGIAGLSKKSRWIPLPEEHLNELGRKYYGDPNKVA